MTTSLEEDYKAVCDRKDFRFLLTVPPEAEERKDLLTDSKHNEIRLNSTTLRWRHPSQRRYNIDYNHIQIGQLGEVFAELQENDATSHVLAMRRGKGQRAKRQLSGVIEMSRADGSEKRTFSRLSDAWLALLDIAPENDVAPFREREKRRIASMLRLARAKHVYYALGTFREILVATEAFLLKRNPFPIEDEDDVIHFIGANDEDQASELYLADNLFQTCRSGDPARKSDRFSSFSAALSNLLHRGLDAEGRSGHELLVLRETINDVSNLASSCHSTEEFAIACRARRFKG